MQVIGVSVIHAVGIVAVTRGTSEIIATIHRMPRHTAGFAVGGVAVGNLTHIETVLAVAVHTCHTLGVINIVIVLYHRHLASIEAVADGGIVGGHHTANGEEVELAGLNTRHIACVEAVGNRVLLCGETHHTANKTGTTGNVAGVVAEGDCSLVGAGAILTDAHHAANRAPIVRPSGFACGFLCDKIAGIIAAYDAAGVGIHMADHTTEMHRV